MLSILLTRTTSPVPNTTLLKKLFEGESEMKQIVSFIDRVLQQPQDAQLHEMVRKEVKALCEQFPTFYSRVQDRFP